MVKIFSILIVSLLIIFCANNVVALNSNEEVPVIIQFKTSSITTNLEADQNQFITTMKNQIGYKGEIKNKYSQLLNGVAMTVKKSDIEKIKSLSEVEMVWEDEEMYVLETPDNINIIRAPEVWQKQDSTGINITGIGVKVAIIDTGIAYDHPDIANCTTEQFLSDNCTRVIYGYDYINKDKDPYDDHGHGTHCAGIVGANGQIKGVAPNVTFMAYKVLGKKGSGWMSDVIAAIENATYSGADVISMSLGGYGFADSEPMKTVIDNAVAHGVVVVSAVGNSGPNMGTIILPGAIESGIGVGAIDNNSKIASFSSRGFTYNLNKSIAGIKPDVVAPGVNIKSTVPIGNCSLCSSTGYRFLSGTSMATPHVAGLAVLLKQAHPDWTVAQIKSAITNPAINLGYDANTQGNGRIDALNSYNVQGAIFPVNIYFGEDNLKKRNIWQVQKSFDFSGSGYTFSTQSDVPVQVSQSENKLTVNIAVNNSLVSNGVKYGRVIATGTDNISIPLALIVKVNNTPPVLGNPTINNTLPTVNDTVNCNPGSYFDEDGDVESNRQWMWYKNKNITNIMTQNIFVGSIINEGWCYQEYANKTSLCGGVAEGSYSCSGQWSIPCLYAFDGDINTRAVALSGTESSIYVNYTIPKNTKKYIWSIAIFKNGVGGGDWINLSIDQCSMTNNKLRFKIDSDYTAPTHTEWFCYTYSGWKSLYFSAGAGIFEEAMWWNMSIEKGLNAINSDNISCQERTSDGVDYSNYAMSEDVMVRGNTTTPNPVPSPNPVPIDNKIRGNIKLVKNDQLYMGIITGNLSGTISLTFNTDYDTFNTQIGTVWSDDITVTLGDGTLCEGMYSGTNINYGVSSGTLIISCDNGKLMQGIVHGINNNIDLKYSLFLMTSIQGSKGDKGETGEQGVPGKDGLNGIDGKDGARGDQGLQGEQGIQGIQGEQGIPGEKGDKGETGEQGIQGPIGLTGAMGSQGLQGEKGLPGNDGEQGLKGDTGENGIQGEQGLQGLPGEQGIQGEVGLRGDKGDNGAQGDQGLQGEPGIQGIQGDVGPKGETGSTANCTTENCTCNPTEIKKITRGLLIFFPDFSDWLNSNDKCINGQFRCVGDEKQKCVNYNWTVDTNCQYGCINGYCNNPPQENCLTKANEFDSCQKYGSKYKLYYYDYYKCKPGQGTNTMCNYGQCEKRTLSKVCAKGCNETTVQCS